MCSTAGPTPISARDDDVLAIGANRAIDLIVAKELGGGFRRGAADPGRPLGADPASGATIVVKAGRFGPYVTDGATNATLPRTTPPEAVTLDEALALIARRRELAGTTSFSRGRKGGAKSRAPAKGGAKAAAKAPAKSAAKAAKKAPAKKAAAKKAAKKKAGSR